MQSRRRLESDLESIVDSIAPVEGVVAVVLFGSRAREEYDEYSDYDLLVLFRDDEALWSNRREIFERIGKTGLFVQVLTRSLMEFDQLTEPSFKDSILRQGRLLYSRYPITFNPFFVTYKPMVLVTFTMRRLEQRLKLSFNYALYGRRGRRTGAAGLLSKVGGFRLGRGVVAIPEEESGKLRALLKEYHVPYVTRRVLLLEENKYRNHKREPFKAS